LTICTLVYTKTHDAGKPYLEWPHFRRSVVAAFPRSLTPGRDRVHRYQLKLLLMQSETSPRVNARLGAR
jgi:hypothetical protein